MSEMYNADNLFEQLSKNGVEIDEQKKRLIQDKISRMLNYEPRIGIFGKTGAGKSSLCNALFGREVCEISDVAACTRNPQEVILNIAGGKGMKIVDVPGVGENSHRDQEYGELYARLLPELDVVLWVLKGDDRAYASDENFYKNLVKPHLDQGKPFFFVLNQVDKIEPFREWDVDKHEPGPNQYMNIDKKVQSVATCFEVPASKVIPVSANEKFNMTKLVDEMIYELPNEKKITVFKGVNEEFRSEATGEKVKHSVMDAIREVVGNALDNAYDAVCDTIDRITDFGDRVVGGICNFIDGFFDFFNI